MHKDIGPLEQYTYLLLYATGRDGAACEPVRDGEHLHAMMFVLSDCVPGLDLGPVEHAGGPFSRTLEGAVARAVEAGMIYRSENDGLLMLTGRGFDTAGWHWSRLDEGGQRGIYAVKELLNYMTHWELVSFIYSKYPGAAAEPGLWREFEARRLEAAVCLFRKEEVSGGKAAEIAGMSRFEFEDELKKRDLPVYILDYESYKRQLRTVDEIVDHQRGTPWWMRRPAAPDSCHAEGVLSGARDPAFRAQSHMVGRDLILAHLVEGTPCLRAARRSPNPLGGVREGGPAWLVRGR